MRSHVRYRSSRSPVAACAGTAHVLLAGSFDRTPPQIDITRLTVRGPTPPRMLHRVQGRFLVEPCPVSHEHCEFLRTAFTSAGAPASTPPAAHPTKEHGGFTNLRMQPAARIEVLPAHLDRPELRNVALSNFRWLTSCRAIGAVVDNSHRERLCILKPGACRWVFL